MDGSISRGCRGGLCGIGSVDPVDPVDLVAEQLMTGEASVWAPGVWAGLDCEFARSHRPDLVPPCLLAGRGMTIYRAAVLAALAARHLQPPGLVTASVLGCGTAAQVQLMVIARYLANVSHVAICVAGDETLDRQVVDELELAGIAFSETRSSGEAMFGASYIVVTDPGVIEASPPHLSRGALLVNATGLALPEAVTRRLSHVFVDDLALLDPAAGRRRPGPQFRGDDVGPAESARPGSGHGQRRRLEGDLRQVLTGEHPGRRCQEQVLLVELLGISGEEARHGEQS